MNRFRNILAVYAAVGLAVFTFSAQISAQVRNEREIRTVVRNLSSGLDDFRYSLRYGVRNSGVAEQDASDAEENVAALDEKLKAFDDNFNQRRENRDDVTDLLAAAKTVNDFVYANRINQTVQNDWSKVRGLFDKLASNYGVSWNWARGTSTTNGSTNYPSTPNTAGSRGLVGTYELDKSRTEDTTGIVDGSGAETEDQKAELEELLAAADQVAIDIRGDQITLASSNAAPASFSADGRVRNENRNGRTIRVRATLRGQELTVSSVGGDSDFTIVFTSLDGGRSLKITRRVTNSFLTQTVFAESFYNKTDAVARLDLGGDRDPDSQNTSDNTTPVDPNDDNGGGYSSNDPDDVPGSTTPNNNPSNYPTPKPRRTGDFIVPSGTIITGILENMITTKASMDNDRFKMTVQQPAEFRGAVIDGYITGINRSGRVSGNSKLTLNFEKITLRNGKTYEFAGFLQSITDANGKVIKIDTEGTAKGDSQTKETAKRAGIGAGAGAIIGAILGGGKGAAIGAVIGGAGGAGTVAVQGKGDLELPKGSTVTVTASGPDNAR